MNFGNTGESGPKTQTNHFNGSMEKANVAFGDHVEQEQNHYNNENAKEIVELLVPLLEKIVKDDKTPQHIQTQTALVLEDLGELAEGNLSVPSMKNKLFEFLPRLASTMGTQFITEAVSAVGQVLAS